MSKASTPDTGWFVIRVMVATRAASSAANPAARANPRSIRKAVDDVVSQTRQLTSTRSRRLGGEARWGLPALGARSAGLELGAPERVPAAIGAEGPRAEWLILARLAHPFPNLAALGVGEKSRIVWHGAHDSGARSGRDHGRTTESSRLCRGAHQRDLISSGP